MAQCGDLVSDSCSTKQARMDGKHHKILAASTYDSVTMER